ncbi:hypothetical protein QO206_03355 [Leeuwenhoekiella aequorea]|uniref:hypothetical protein n=1 Tax=Leeuwenhoekiella aequorea TaxID=283736 RepID=UPI00352EF9C4|tara:strand:+ start:21927 stop:22442 length:516 start_codon:yes stop_codon:yes gene_type:complete
MKKHILIRWFARLALALALVLIILSAGGCKSKATLTETTTIRDSTVTTIKVTPRDTVIRVAGDSLQLKVSLAKLRENLYITETRNRVTASVGLQGDELTVDCKIDSLLVELELRDTIITTLRERLEKKATVKEVPVKYVPWYIKILAWIGGLTVVYLGVKLALFIKSKKPF